MRYPPLKKQALRSAFYGSAIGIVLTGTNTLLAISNNLDNNFYYDRFSSQENEEWTVIELRDGQISGLQNYNVELFYDELSKVIA